MKKETIEKLIDAVGVKLEEMQNTINAKSQLWLNNGIATKDASSWYSRQYATLDELRNALNKIANGYVSEIEKAVKDVYIKELNLVNTELSSVVDTDIELPEDVQAKINKLTEPIKSNVNVLVDETINNHKQDVANVFLTANTALLNNKNNVGVQFQVQSTKVLYDAIVKATSRGIQNMPSVVLSDGRHMNWKSYIEMATRTMLKQEASAYQKESGNQLGVIFWLLSSHFDCADDHAPYQGRIYVVRNWQSKVADEELRDKISKYISSKKILFKDQVDEPGGLLQRPIEQWNCRHYFQPLTIDQALGCTTSTKRDDLLNELQMKGGEYDRQNYIDLQEQRYNERKIRQYKAQLEKDNLQLESAPKEADTALIKQYINRDKMLVSRWQLRQRNLIRSNQLLTRDYRRESNTIIQSDLGVRYDMKNK